MISFFVAAAMAVLPYAPQDLIYQSEGEIERSWEEWEGMSGGALDRFVDLSRSKDYDGAYRAWSDLQFTFFSFCLKLGQTASIDKAMGPLIEKREASFRRDFQKKIEGDSRLLEVFLENAKGAGELSLQQRAFTQNILKEYREIDPKKGKEIDGALKNFLGLPKGDYAVSGGKVSQEEKRELSVLTANIICFPGKLPYLFGGISPWKGRIDAIAKKIISSKADLVCLQEVWDPEATRALIDLLKGDYSYFVYDAGDPAGTVAVDEMGYGSGLFIASKLELEEIDFRLFKRSIPTNSRRGMLSAACRLGQERIAFITTHLQHGEDVEMVRTRKEQLLACHERLEELIGKEPNSWGFLAGDLNVDGFSSELKESHMRDLFILPRIDPLKERSATATNYFTDLVRTPLDKRKDVRVSLEFLDYCIRPLSSLKKVSFVQEKMILFSIDAPEDALSDHQGVLTTWSF